jgi:hypothetical protein
MTRSRDLVARGTSRLIGLRVVEGRKRRDCGGVFVGIGGVVVGDHHGTGGRGDNGHGG